MPNPDVDRQNIIKGVLMLRAKNIMPNQFYFAPFTECGSNVYYSRSSLNNANQFIINEYDIIREATVQRTHVCCNDS